MSLDEAIAELGDMIAGRKPVVETRVEYLCNVVKGHVHSIDMRDGLVRRW